MTMMAMVAFAAVVAQAVGSIDTTEMAPGFVSVSWSERDGEKWTVEGFADREAGRPMDTNTVFSICSNTKTVTSVLVLTLVEEGVLNLDDPVSKYFPEFERIRIDGKVPKRPIALRHLITHTAGFASFSLNNPGVLSDMTSYLDCVRLAVEKGLSSEPGEVYRYCNVGFQVMGAIIEKVTGKKASDLMKERIFDPLGMAETTFYPDDAMMARVAVPYYYPPKGGKPLRYDFDNRSTVPLGNRSRTALLSSGIMCTAGDFLKFSQMMARKGLGMNGRRILTERTFDEILLKRQTPAGDARDFSFDIAFSKDRTSGNKGGLYATAASWNWSERSCLITFRAKSPYAPKGAAQGIDASGFGGPKTSFAVSDVKSAEGKTTCRISNTEDRHGIGNVQLVVNGAVVEERRVELAIGESKLIVFDAKTATSDVIAVRVVMR